MYISRRANVHCTSSLIAEMPLIYKVPVGIANLGGTDEAKHIVTKNGDDYHDLSEHHDERERLREHD